jgi:hypothetical protein
MEVNLRKKSDILQFSEYLIQEITQLYTLVEVIFDPKMTEKNQDIHHFIIEEAYERIRSRHNLTFSTTECALEKIFGSNFK